MRPVGRIRSVITARSNACCGSWTPWPRCCVATICPLSPRIGVRCCFSNSTTSSRVRRSRRFLTRRSRSWRRARRQTRRDRDVGLQRLFVSKEGAASEPRPWLWMGWQPLARWSPLLRLPVGRWCVDCRPLPQQPCLSGGVWVQLPSQQGISSVALACSPDHEPVTASGTQPRHPLVVEALAPQRRRVSAMAGWPVTSMNRVWLPCRGLMGWSSWRDRCGCAATAIGVSSGMPGIWQLITVSSPCRCTPWNRPNCGRLAPWSVLLVQRFQLGTSELGSTCDSEPTAPGSSSSPALTGGSAMNCCAWNWTSPKGLFGLLPIPVEE